MDGRCGGQEQRSCELGDGSVIRPGAACSLRLQGIKRHRANAHNKEYGSAENNLETEFDYPKKEGYVASGNMLVQIWFME
ncbi:hypothetical protein ABZP36_004748 [Zizania latifolia]